MGRISVRDHIARYRQVVRRILETSRTGRFSGIYRHLVYESRFSLYVRKVMGTVTEALMLLAATYVLCLVLLHLSSMMWGLYQQTPMGKQFLVMFDDRSHLISAIMAMEFRYFAWEITLAAFTVCMGVSAVCWFFCIGRYFYYARNLLHRLLFWGLPLSFAVAFHLSGSVGFPVNGVLVAVAVVPTMCLFMNCFNYAERLLPECGDIVLAGGRIAKAGVEYIKARLNKPA